jgi:D-aminopeptidase
MGLARMGSYAGDGSGDIFVAFSTANAEPLGNGALPSATFMENDKLDAIFEATVQATEESIVNALVAAKDMDGVDGHYAKALPHAELKMLLERYGRGTTPR